MFTNHQNCPVQNINENSYKYKSTATTSLKTNFYCVMAREIRVCVLLTDILVFHKFHSITLRKNNNKRHI